VVSVVEPDTLPKVTIKHNLETSIISNAPFAAGFLKAIWIFLTCQDAPFQARFWGMIKLELHRNSINLLICLNG